MDRRAIMFFAFVLCTTLVYAAVVQVTATSPLNITGNPFVFPNVTFDKNAFNLDDINQVNAPNPTNGQVLKWDASDQNWKPGTDNTGASGYIPTEMNIDQNWLQSHQIYGDGNFTGGRDANFRAIDVNLLTSDGNIVISPEGNIGIMPGHKICLNYPVCSSYLWYNPAGGYTEMT